MKIIHGYRKRIFPTDRLKRDTQYPLVSFNTRHFPVSVFHDCQMRSPVFSRSCPSPPSSRISRWIEHGTNRTIDNRGFRFERGVESGEWRVESGAKGRPGSSGQDLRCFQLYDALARFSVQIRICAQNGDDINARKWFTGIRRRPRGKI